MFNLDYTPKTLHVAIRNLDEITIAKKDEEIENGLIYNPELVFSKINDTSEMMYNEFFKKEGSYILVPIETEQGPGELGNVFSDKYGSRVTWCVGGITAPFIIDNEKAKLLLNDLKENPAQFFNSQDKKIYAGNNLSLYSGK